MFYVVFFQTSKTYTDLGDGLRAFNKTDPGVLSSDITYHLTRVWRIKYKYQNVICNITVHDLYTCIDLTNGISRHHHYELLFDTCKHIKHNSYISIT